MSKMFQVIRGLYMGLVEGRRPVFIGHSVAVHDAWRSLGVGSDRLCKLDLRALEAVEKAKGVEAVLAMLSWYKSIRDQPYIPQLRNPRDLQDKWERLATIRESSVDPDSIPGARGLADTLSVHPWPVDHRRLVLGVALSLYNYERWLAAYWDAMQAQEPTTHAALNYFHNRMMDPDAWVETWYIIIAASRRRAWDPVDQAWHWSHTGWLAWGNLLAVEYCGDARVWPHIVEQIGRRIK